jgi:quinol monooxygenase YgiN
MSLQVNIVATITPNAGSEDVVHAAIRTAVQEVKSEAGCERYEAYASVDTPGEVVIVERYRDAAAVDEHVNGAALKKLAAVLQGRATLKIVRLEDFN